MVEVRGARILSFGATFGDFLTKPVEHGGLDAGTIGSSLFFVVVLVMALARETQLEWRRMKQATSPAV